MRTRRNTWKRLICPHPVTVEYDSRFTIDLLSYKYNLTLLLGKNVMLHKAIIKPFECRRLMLVIEEFTNTNA
jgi:hypothetical protein